MSRRGATCEERDPYDMNVLVVGNGGREHAIAWKLNQSPNIDRLVVAPGNPGTGAIAENVMIAPTDLDSLIEYAMEEAVDLTVIGPEAPLADGIADRFQEAGLVVFGPTAAAARIETSKSFAKELMERHKIPTGCAEIFDEFDEAKRYLSDCEIPVAVKANGLAGGKGVVTAQTREEAECALRRFMLKKEFGDAGGRVLIEEFLYGPEISIFAFVDGEIVSPMIAACDYKRVFDGDSGPNTGGMGAYSPPSGDLWNAEVQRRVRVEIMEPIARAMVAEGYPYTGALYAGLMMTKDGPKVIEFNCRLGDPEAQVILPRLRSDLLDAMMATAHAELRNVSLEWDPRVCVGIVLVSGGYPGEYEIGHPIQGIDDVDDDVMVFHAGTRAPDQGLNTLVSNGGRVVTISALGATYEEARYRAYDNVARVRFNGAFYREDIALIN